MVCMDANTTSFLLSASGGIAIVPKDALRSVVDRLGYSSKPTGILVVQSPDELGLEGCPRSLVACSMSVRSSKLCITTGCGSTWDPFSLAHQSPPSAPVKTGTV